MKGKIGPSETQEGQLNAVFACFGSAAQHAQMFEEALGHFLLAYNVISREKMSAEQLKELTQGIQARTMGQLLNQLKSLVTFNEEDCRERMEAALKVRNYLMHSWFLDRREAFNSEAGRMALLQHVIREAVVAREQLKRLRLGNMPRLPNAIDGFQYGGTTTYNAPATNAGHEESSSRSRRPSSECRQCGQRVGMLVQNQLL
jgi:hypothetical protein